MNNNYKLKLYFKSFVTGFTSSVSSSIKNVY